MEYRQKNLRSIDLNLLTVFEAIMEHRQLSAAGQQVGLSQPAMSAALQRLRVMLNDELFVRAKYGMVPTEKAQHWYEEIAPILNQLRQSFSSKSESPYTSARCFKIVAGDYFETVFLAPLLARIEAEAPSVSVQIAPLSEQGVPDDFRYGKYDFALYRSLPPGSGVNSQVIGEETLAVISREQHPRIQHDLQLRHFCSEKHVVLDSPRHSRFGLNSLIPAHDVQRDILATVTSFSAAAHIVECTDALCTVPTGLVPFLRERFAIRAYDFPVPLKLINRMLIWPKVLEEDRIHCWFKDLLLEVIGKNEVAVHENQ